MTRCVALAAIVGSHASAQSAPAATTTLRGVVYDSLRARPLAGALVEIDGLAHTALADGNGRFRIEGVPAGRWRVAFSAPSLDSIGLFGFGAPVVADGGEREVALATPSFATMHARLCAPGGLPQRDSAIVFGIVRDSATRAPVEGARVRFRWDGATAAGVVPAREATSGVDGSYGLCGLPASVVVRTSAAGAPETPLAITPARLVRHDFLVDGARASLAKAVTALVPGIADTMRMGADRVGFIARQRSSRGFFLEREAFQRHAELAGVLLLVPGLDVDRAGGRLEVTVRGRFCPPLLVVDGERMPSTNDFLKGIRPSDVLALEYHRLPSNAVPPALVRGGRDCGAVLMIWTTAARW